MLAGLPELLKQGLLQEIVAQPWFQEDLTRREYPIIRDVYKARSEPAALRQVLAGGIVKVARTG